MENVIYDSDREVSIGFYKDIVDGYRKIIKEFRDKGDTENAVFYQNELAEIREWKGYEGLLELSENNGMGFTCKAYKEERPNLKPYELTVLFKQECDFPREINKVYDLVEKFGGRVVKVADEGDKRLAYSISGREFARHLYYDIEIPDGGAAKISSCLNIKDSVLRYLLVKGDERRR